MSIPNQSDAILNFLLGDEEKINLVCLDKIHERQSIHTRKTGVDSAIKHDFTFWKIKLNLDCLISKLLAIFTLELQHYATATDLLTSSKRSDQQYVAFFRDTIGFSFSHLEFFPVCFRTLSYTCDMFMEKTVIRATLSKLEF